MTDDLSRAIKVVTDMTPEDTIAHSKKEIEWSEQRDDPNLRQLLTSSSKSMNYSNQGYLVDFKNNNSSEKTLDSINAMTIASLNIHKDAKWIREKKGLRGEANEEQNPFYFSSLNEISQKLNKQETQYDSSSTSDIEPQKTKEPRHTVYATGRMGLEWRRIPNIFAQESKRKKKELEKKRDLKLAHSLSSSITAHHAYHNEAIINIESQMGEMLKRNAAPTQENRPNVLLNGNNSLNYGMIQPMAQGYGHYNGYQQSNSNPNYAYGPSNGFYGERKTVQLQAGTSEELFMISKKNKLLNGNLYSNNFDFDNDDFLDYKKKGKKRSRKTKKEIENEF